MRRFFALIAVPAVAMTAAALIPAGSNATIQADQPFDGYVNNAKKAATVTVIGCFNPGDTGTIKSGQTWKVGLGTHGQQGDFDGDVVATLGAASTHITDYNIDFAIPQVAAPCSGTAAATFVPSQPGADAKSTQVGVQYVGVASS